MSSILADYSSAPLFQHQDASGGLRIIGQNDQSNFFTVESSGFNDPPVGSNDTIIGGDESDVINGGLLDDLIIGGEGSDLLEGGEGDDILIGDDGADVLKGGDGSDLMTSGKGADVFEFFADDLNLGELDKITDFTQGMDGSIEDVIHLRGIGNDADVAYDNDTGKVSLNGEDILQLDAGLELTMDDNDQDGNWELF